MRFLVLFFLVKCFILVVFVCFYCYQLMVNKDHNHLLYFVHMSSFKTEHKHAKVSSKILP